MDLVPKTLHFNFQMGASATREAVRTLPMGANIKRVMAVPNINVATSATAADHLVVTIDVEGTTVGTITNNSSQTPSYNPPRRVAAYTANEPNTLDFERRPGIDYDLVDQGDRAEVMKVAEFNKFINVAPNDELRIAVSSGANLTTLSRVDVVVEYYDGGWGS